MASGNYAHKTSQHLPAEEKIATQIPARATRNLPVTQAGTPNSSYDAPETKLPDPLNRSLPHTARPRTGQKKPLSPRRQIVIETPPWYSSILFRGVTISYNKINGLFPQAWAWILCLFGVICFLVLFLTVGILQRPLLSIDNGGEAVYDLARTWKQQHPTASQTPLPILQSDLPAGLSVDHPYVLYAWDAAQKASISPKIFVRQINQESGFNPQAVSPVGAIGIAQFMPGTAAGLSNPLGSGQLDPWNPQEALTAAALYMAAKLQTYGGDYAKALASYNAGSGGVQNAINKAIQTDGTPDTWRKYLPAETQRYIQIILG